MNLHDSHGIVIEYSRHVFGREFVGCIGDQETGLSDSTVTDNDTSKGEKTKISI